jgi:hypothetical protein
MLQKASLVTGDFRLTKSFNFGGLNNLIVSLHVIKPSSITIARDLQEGAYTSIYISEFNRTNSKDSTMLTLQIVGDSNKVFELSAIKGRIFMSKKNGILRFTTDGKLTLNGFNSQPPGEAQTRTLEFSVENGVSF